MVPKKWFFIGMLLASTLSFCLYLFRNKIEIAIPIFLILFVGCIVGIVIHLGMGYWLQVGWGELGTKGPWTISIMNRIRICGLSIGFAPVSILPILVWTILMIFQ